MPYIDDLRRGPGLLAKLGWFNSSDPRGAMLSPPLLKVPAKITDQPPQDLQQALTQVAAGQPAQAPLEQAPMPRIATPEIVNKINAGVVPNQGVPGVTPQMPQTLNEAVSQRAVWERMNELANRGITNMGTGFPDSPQEALLNKQQADQTQANAQAMQALSGFLHGQAAGKAATSQENVLERQLKMASINAARQMEMQWLKDNPGQIPSTELKKYWSDSGNYMAGLGQEAPSSANIPEIASTLIPGEEGTAGSLQALRTNPDVSPSTIAEASRKKFGLSREEHQKELAKALMQHMALGGLTNIGNISLSPGQDAFTLNVPSGGYSYSYPTGAYNPLAILKSDVPSIRLAMNAAFGSGDMQKRRQEAEQIAKMLESYNVPIRNK